MRIFTGLVMIAIGALLIIKTEKFLSIFGRIGFFDRFLGTEGGSRLGYKLLGLLLVFLGILTVTDMIDSFLNWLLSPLLINKGI